MSKNNGLTVGQAIEALQKLPPETKLQRWYQDMDEHDIEAGEGEWIDVLDIQYIENKGVVQIS